MDSRDQHYVGEVAQKAIIEKEGKVLLSRYPKDKVYDLPGGRINREEQPGEGLAREIKEELGLDVIVGAPVFATVVKFEFDQNDRYFVCFKVTLDSPEQEFVLEKEEVAEITWISKDEVETAPMFEVCRNGLRAYFAQKY